LDAVGRLADFLHRRQQQTDEDGDDGNDDEELDEGKPAARFQGADSVKGITLRFRKMLSQPGEGVKRPGRLDRWAGGPLRCHAMTACKRRIDQLRGTGRRLLTSPSWPLVVTVLAELALFAGYFHERWHKALVPLGRPRALTGEGLVVRSDGLGYYAWLRSLLVDGDWSFDNEFDRPNVVPHYVPPPQQRPPLRRP